MSTQAFLIASNILFYWLAFLVSVWIGNFITSFYYRIPRGIALNGMQNPPMCSGCGIRLKYPDYGPLYYYLFKAKNCKACGAGIPGIYCLIELFIGLTIMLNFLLNGISELSVAEGFAIAFLFLILFIDVSHKQVYEKSLVFLLVCMLVRGFYLHGTEQFAYQTIVSGMIICILATAFLPKGTAIGYKRFFYILAIGFNKVDAIAITLICFALYFVVRLVYKNQTQPIFVRHITPVSGACVLAILNILI
jgi:prepilin signal peptidase PulO-like enzyme (type II secretory pathway)